jgi:hypothetical protein
MSPEEAISAPATVEFLQKTLVEPAFAATKCKAPKKRRAVNVVSIDLKGQFWPTPIAATILLRNLCGAAVFSCNEM